MKRERKKEEDGGKHVEITGRKGERDRDSERDRERHRQKERECPTPVTRVPFGSPRSWVSS